LLMRFLPGKNKNDVMTPFDEAYNRIEFFVTFMVKGEWSIVNWQWSILYL